MNINFDKTITVVTQPEKTLKTTTLTIQRMVDIPTQKIVRVLFKEIPMPYVLWQDNTYDAIGQWTDVDIENRVKEIFGG